MITYFISGHLTYIDEEFEFHYVPKLLAAIKDGASFVVGDANGIDRRAQYFLAGQRQVSVTVYHMFDKPRNNYGFPTIGGFTSDSSRDKAMTLASDADIAWVRPGRENSGTARNIERRAKLLSKKPPWHIIGDNKKV